MYLSCHDIPSKRLTNDNWSHDDAELSVWQMLTNYCNNKKIIPETEEIPDLHSEYSKLERILHELVENMHMATQEQCKDKIFQMMREVVKGMGVLKLLLTWMKMQHMTMAKIILNMLLISNAIW